MSQPMGRALALAPIPAAFALGALAARVSLAVAPARIAIDRAQPLVVVTAWGGYGALAFAIFAATIALAGAALWLALAREAETPAGPGIVPVLAVAATSLAACATWPFTFSSDPYAYAAYGDLALRGIDPYLTVPANFHDAFTDAARFQWSGAFPPCVYGPAFVLLARGIVAISGTPFVALALFRIISALAFLAGLACAYRALAGVPERARFATIATFALHPVVLWSVAEGHNDALVAGAAGAALLLARKAGAPLAAFAASLVVAIKATVLPLAGAFALNEFASRRPKAMATLAALAGGTALAALVTVPPLLEVLGMERSRGHYAPSVSLQELAGPVPALILAILAAAVGAIALRNGRRSGLAWLGLAAYAVLPNPYPWYALWLAPLALAASGPASRALLGVTICSALRYLPDAYGDMPGGWLVAASAASVLPALLALPGLRADLTAPQKVLA